MALAEQSDVETRLGRPLTDGPEIGLVLQLLADVEGMLLARIPTLLTRAADEDDYAARVTAVEAAAVVRVLRNPDGYRTEATGPFSTTYDTRAAAGFLTVLAEEWRTLGESSAWTIAPSLSMPTGFPTERSLDLLYGWR